MKGVYLPGNSTAIIKELPDPAPGYGQVVVKVMASTICGSDVRAIYREHAGGDPAERYQNVVAGHEPAGQVTAVGEGVQRLAIGDRVCVYHISGCGQCPDCVDGYQINCTSPARAAYGWQRDGGHAELMLAEERDCIVLPDFMSYLDGACVACGFGTAYEGLVQVGASGRDSLAVVGLGPVGLAAGLLGGALGAMPRVGIDPSPERRQLALDKGAVDIAVAPDEASQLRSHLGRGAHLAVDCSGSAQGRTMAIELLRRWGRLVLIGEGGSLQVDEVSPALIHPSIRVQGSWVTSLGHMTELVERLPVWGLHPEVVVTKTVGLDEADEGYRAAAAGEGGKVAVLPHG